MTIQVTMATYSFGGLEHFEVQTDKRKKNVAARQLRSWSGKKNTLWFSQRTKFEKSTAAITEAPGPETSRREVRDPGLLLLVAPMRCGLFPQLHLRDEQHSVAISVLSPAAAFIYALHGCGPWVVPSSRDTLGAGAALLCALGFACYKPRAMDNEPRPLTTEQCGGSSHCGLASETDLQVKVTPAYLLVHASPGPHCPSLSLCSYPGQKQSQVCKNE